MRKLLAKLWRPKAAPTGLGREVTPAEMTELIEHWLKRRGWEKRGEGFFAWFRSDDPEPRGFTRLGALDREFSGSEFRELIRKGDQKQAHGTQADRAHGAEHHA